MKAEACLILSLTCCLWCLPTCCRSTSSSLLLSTDFSESLIRQAQQEQVMHVLSSPSDKVIT